MASFNIDADSQEDWLKKRGWDLPVKVDQFLTAIGGELQVKKFMELPAARAMPNSLRAELTTKNLL